MGIRLLLLGNTLSYTTKDTFLPRSTRLEAELAELEISPEAESRFTEIAALVRERLSVATFQGMRDLLELLNVKVVYYHNDQGVRLRVSCEIPGTEEDIVLTSF